MSVPERVFEHTLSVYLAPVAPLLHDDEVTEILVNRHDEIYVERGGALHLTHHEFASEYALMSALRNLSQYVGRELCPSSPVLEARLPDGSRVEAVVPPASPRGAVVCIRRFRRERLTLDRFVELGTLGSEVADLLRAMVQDRQNVVIGGGSGAGKTSLLNAVASAARPDERIIVIEDSKELQLELPHVVHLEAQPPDSRGLGEITVRQLLKATLRMRPDRILIGEIRGKEALELIQAMTSGHRGCLSTLHGTLPIDTLSRLETMALMSDVRMPISALRTQIASAVDVVIQVSRQADGMRRVTHVAEVVGFDATHGYCLRSLLPEDETR